MGGATVTSGTRSGSAGYFASLRDMAETVIARDSASISTQLRVADVPCAVHVNDAGLLAALTDGLAGVNHASSSDTCELMIRGWTCEAAGVSLPPPPDEGAEVALRGELPAVDGDRYRFAFFAHSRTLMAADALAGECFIITESSRGFTGFERASPMRGPLSWLLPPKGRVLVHAGAVALGGKAALLIGRGGAGKSTLATWALQHGWGYIGDDLVAISRFSPFTAYSLYRTAKLSEQSPLPLPETTYVPEWQERGGKKIYRLDRGFSQNLLPSADLVAVVFIDRDGHDANLQPLSPAVAASVVATTTHSLLPGAGGEVLAAVARLTRNTQCWRLNPGATPANALACLEMALAAADRTDVGVR